GHRPAPDRGDPGGGRGPCDHDAPAVGADCRHVLPGHQDAPGRQLLRLPPPEVAATGRPAPTMRRPGARALCSQHTRARCLPASRQAGSARRATVGYIDFITWPRISPPLFAAVWTLKYHLPAARSAAWASVRVASPLIGLVTAPLTGTTTPALVLASA